MIDLIKTKIGNEEIIGIIPLFTKTLNISFLNKSYKTNFLNWILYFFIGIIPAALITYLVVFLILNIENPDKAVVSIFFTLEAFLIYIIKEIHENKFKKLPVTMFVITESNFYFFAIFKNKIEIEKKYEIDFNSLKKVFFGEYDKATKNIGPKFEIKKNNKILFSGELLISKNKLFSEDIDEKYLLPTEKLREIFEN